MTAPLGRRMAPFDPSVLLPMRPGRSPRAWQAAATIALREACTKWRSPLVSAATGTGKGDLIAGLIVSMARRGRRVLFLVHRDDLIKDVMARALAIEPGLPAGKVQGDHNEIDQQCVFASVASLGVKRLAQLGAFDAIIIDEAHHATAPSYQRIVARVREQFARVLLIGFTATPFRSAPDGQTKGLGGVFDGIAFEYDLAQAIADGALCPLACIQIRTELEVQGTDDDEALARQIDTPPRNQLLVDKWLEHTPGKPTVVFCATVKHAQNVALAFKARGVRALAVWGEMRQGDRDAALDLYRTRPDILPVLCNKDLLTEGFDAPKTEVVILARPTESRGLFAQMVGRCTRLSPETGKTQGMVLDLVDNTTAHDLASFADLTRPEDRAPLPLEPGVKVRHKTDKELDNGTVMEVEGQSVPRARVQWGRRDERWHPSRDLVRIVARSEEIVFRVVPRIAGVQEFAIQLFGDGARKPSVGWYATTSSKGEKRLTATGGTNPVLTVQLIDTPAGWEAWRVLTEELPPLPVDPEMPPRQEDGRPRRRVDVVELLPPTSFDLAQSAGAHAFVEARIPPKKFGADWQSDPATDAQRRALVAFGAKPETLSSISKGEAAMQLEARMARAKIDPKRRKAGRTVL